LSTFVDIADALEIVCTVNLSLDQVVAVADCEDSRGVHAVWHIEGGAISAIDIPADYSLSGSENSRQVE
jgi:hypothetical protein